METLLKHFERIIAILSGLAGLVGVLISLVGIVQRPHVQLQVDKDRNRVPVHLLARLSGQGLPSLADYQDPHFGSVSLDITNRTDNQVTPTLELGGLKKFNGAELVDSQLAGTELSDYQAKLGRVALQSGEPCPAKQWPDRGDQKLDLPVPPLQSYGGHITLAVYGSPFESADVCLSGAPVDTRYLIRIRDSSMLHQYWYWIAGLSVLLLATSIFRLIQSMGRRAKHASSSGTNTDPAALGVGKN
jgi:uncharacterized membrane protein YuzA (DUF378 family)